ncbi:helix-turn-helix domain-containing protein [Poriferisphaera sp. WC338]|uniref:helix-turn-helix domain-containing protein n=1 Tax=Poriferisphaera sp. WC338 TaxID=3425129 RepID=UPI003D81BA57
MGTSAQQSLAYKKLQKRLRSWREAAELTQRDLGDILGKPHSYVHKCETGDRRIDPVELIHWCRACEINPTTAIKQLAKDVR